MHIDSVGATEALTSHGPVTWRVVGRKSQAHIQVRELIALLIRRCNSTNS